MEGLARVRYATRAVPVRVGFLFIIQPSLPSITQKKTSRHDKENVPARHRTISSSRSSLVRWYSLFDSVPTVPTRITLP